MSSRSQVAPWTFSNPAFICQKVSDSGNVNMLTTVNVIMTSMTGHHFFKKFTNEYCSCF